MCCIPLIPTGNLQMTAIFHLLANNVMHFISTTPLTKLGGKMVVLLKRFFFNRRDGIPLHPFKFKPLLFSDNKDERILCSSDESFLGAFWESFHDIISLQSVTEELYWVLELCSKFVPHSSAFTPKFPHHIISRVPSSVPDISLFSFCSAQLCTNNQ